MTDEAKTQEEASEVQEVEGSPSPSVPSVPSTAAPSAATLDADALVERLTEKLGPVIEDKVARTFQTAKDRRYASVERIHKYLQEAGGDVAKATKQMQLDELYEQMASQESGGTDAQRNESDKAYMEARSAQLLSGAGIDFDDPDYKVLVAQYANRISDPERWIDIVEGFVNQKTSKKEKSERITPAAAGSEPGKTAVPADEGDLNALTKELVNLQRQRPTPEIMAKRKELRQKIGAIQDKMDFTLAID